MGPIAVAEHLAPFRPDHPLVKDTRTYGESVTPLNAIERLTKARQKKKYAEKNKLTIADKGPAKCAYSGGPAKAKQKLVVNGKAEYFCCGKCKAKRTKELNIVKKDAETKSCPISGADADAKTTMIVTSATKVYFCCDKCPKGYAKKHFTKKGKVKKDA